jgi:hypothetical protein
MNQLEDMATSVNFTSTNSAMTRSYKDELQNIKDEFRTFLETYGSHLHIPTTYKLIASHGFNSELLYYVYYIGDYERVIENWISENQWQKAIEVLDGQVRDAVVYIDFILIYLILEQT